MVEVKGEFTRRFEMDGAWDRSSPDPAKNYGVHSVEMRWSLVGALGVLQFTLFTGWYPKAVLSRLEGRPMTVCGLNALPAGLFFHSPRPLYEGHVCRACDLLEGGRCFCEGSYSDSNDVFDALVNAGEEGVWKFLGEHYDRIVRSMPDGVA